MPNVGRTEWKLQRRNTTGLTKVMHSASRCAPLRITTTTTTVTATTAAAIVVVVVVIVVVATAVGIVVATPVPRPVPTVAISATAFSILARPFTREVALRGTTANFLRWTEQCSLC